MNENLNSIDSQAVQIFKCQTHSFLLNTLMWTSEIRKLATKWSHQEDVKLYLIFLYLLTN